MANSTMRQTFCRFLSIFCLLSLPTSAHAQEPTAATALRDIQNTYNFDPSKLSFEEQAKRAPTLSALWDRYDKTSDVYRDALRTALKTPGARELLYCDGGMQLLAKSKLPEDLNPGLQSISKCGLAEIEHTPYFYTMHALASRGIDTLDLQFRILAKQKFSAYIVAHALNLGQDYAFIYPLLVQDESKYVPRLAERARIEKDPTASATLTKALFYAATSQAESALKSLASGASYAPATRNSAAKMVEQATFIRSLVASDSNIRKLSELIGMDNSAGETELRSKRRARMRSISDEALIELDAYTAFIYRSFKP